MSRLLSENAACVPSSVHRRAEQEESLPGPTPCSYHITLQGRFLSSIFSKPLPSCRRNVETCASPFTPKKLPALPHTLRDGHVGPGAPPASPATPDRRGCLQIHSLILIFSRLDFWSDVFRLGAWVRSLAEFQMRM